MEIVWVSIKNELPSIGEYVLTCDKMFPDDGFQWECRIDCNEGVEWSSSYSVSHFARLNIKEVEG